MQKEEVEYVEESKSQAKFESDSPKMSGGGRKKKRVAVICTVRMCGYSLTTWTSVPTEVFLPAEVEATHSYRPASLSLTQSREILDLVSDRDSRANEP